jgi:hypothetical protein
MIICLLAGNSGEDTRGSQPPISALNLKATRGSKNPKLRRIRIGRSNDRSTSEYEVSERDHPEGQHGTRQDREHAPDSQLGVRFRQPQHVYGGVIRVEVIDVLCVPGSVRHGQMLAMKAAHFWKDKMLLAIQNGTFTTHF